jgi:hypothetical protein
MSSVGKRKMFGCDNEVPVKRKKGLSVRNSKWHMIWIENIGDLFFGGSRLIMYNNSLSVLVF